MSRAFATPEIDARMLTLRGAGKSFEAIANALGCSPTTAWKRIEELLSLIHISEPTRPY